MTFNSMQLARSIEENGTKYYFLHDIVKYEPFFPFIDWTLALALPVIDDRPSTWVLDNGYVHYDGGNSFVGVTEFQVKYLEELLTWGHPKDLIEFIYRKLEEDAEVNGWSDDELSDSGLTDLQASGVKNEIEVVVERAKRLPGQNLRVRRRELPNTLTVEQWAGALAHFNYRCAYCDAPLSFYAAKDHFIPVASPHCPGMVIGNVVPACQSCNSSKHSKDPQAWLIERFGLERTNIILARIYTFFAAARETAPALPEPPR